MNRSLGDLLGDARIISMTEWNGILVVATENNLYAVMRDGSVELMTFKVVDGAIPPQDRVVEGK